MDLTQLPITHHAIIPESYLDEMGHMNVMWYTHLFSEATGGLFQLVGMTWEYFESNQFGSFALEEHIRYLAEVRVGKAVTVRSRLLGRSTKRLHFIHFLILDESGVLSATGEYVGAHIDMRVRRMAPFSQVIGEALDRMIEAHRQLSWDPPTCGVMRP